MAIDKVVDSAVLDGYFSDIADAIRIKNTELTGETFTPGQMPDAIENLPASDPNLEALFDGTATGSVTIKNIKHIDMIPINLGGEDLASPVEELHLPDTLSICHDDNNSNYAKASGIRDANSSCLRILDIPQCTRLYIHNARNNNSVSTFQKLQELNAPKLEQIHGNLRGCGIEHLDLPSLTSMDTYMFWYTSTLEDVSLPELSSLATSAFSWCTSLSSVYLPMVTDVGNYALRNSAIKILELPNISFSIGTAACRDCTSLEIVDVCKEYINGQISIYASAFLNCSKLVAFVNRSLYIADLLDSNAFKNTPIEDGSGYIYVPRDMVSTYKEETNWSVYADQFRALEDYTDDGTLSGEFIMPTE